MTFPLAGLRIVERSSSSARPGESLAVMLAGRMAADLGATVLMIEPPGGDPLRAGKDHGLFAFLNAGKQSHVLTDGDAEGLRYLLEGADALIADAATAASAGTPGAALSPDRPIAVVAVSLLGSDVPTGMPASEFTVMALGGMLDIVGDPAREPLRLGGHQLAYSAGLSALTGLVAALSLPVRKERGERVPETVDVSLLETAIWLNWKSVAAAEAGEPVPRRSGQAGDWPVVRCADGWVALVYQDADWPGLRKLAGDDPRLADPALATAAGRRGRTGEIGRVVEEHLVRLTRHEIHDRALAARLPLGPVSSVAELIADPHLVAREFLQTVRSGTAGASLAMPRLPLLWDGKVLPPGPVPTLGAGTVAGAAEGDVQPGAATGAPMRPRPARRGLPLDGCRVLDLGIITAGAATSALLADLGAEVIKVESPGYRDPFRFWQGADGGIDSDLPTFFRYTNRNKSGASLDLKQPAGRDAFLRLVAQSDVVVENFRRGVMTRLGIDHMALKAVNGALIFASLSSQGETGPDANYVSYGTTLEAMAGLAWLTGYADGGPVVTGKDLNYPDQVVAIFAAGMIAAAWLKRRRTGEGAHLDLSQRELTAFLAGEAFVSPPALPRRGNAEPGYAVQECFRARDGWVALSVRADQISAFVTLSPDPVDWIGTMSRDEAVGALAAQGIAAAPVLDGAEVLAERGTRWHHALAEGPEGRLAKGFPFQLRGSPLSVVADAPHVGQDTARVLAEVGGFPPEEIARLVTAGAAECWQRP